MQFLIVLPLAAVLGLVPACIAKLKGHNFLAWWFFGFLLWIVATPIAVVMGPDQEALDSEAIDRRGRRRCPHCAELVRRQAVVCRYCGRDMIVVTKPAPIVISTTDG
jgi:hypothetical protein